MAVLKPICVRQIWSVHSVASVKQPDEQISFKWSTCNNKQPLLQTCRMAAGWPLIICVDIVTTRVLDRCRGWIIHLDRRAALCFSLSSEVIGIHYASCSLFYWNCYPFCVLSPIAKLSLALSLLVVNVASSLNTRGLLGVWYSECFHWVLGPLMCFWTLPVFFPGFVFLSGLPISYFWPLLATPSESLIGLITEPHQSGLLCLCLVLVLLLACTSLIIVL